MSYIYTRGTLRLSDRAPHTWTDAEGRTYSRLDLGDAEITFGSAEEARQVAARCLDIADDIDAEQARHRSARAAKAVTP